MHKAFKNDVRVLILNDYKGKIGLSDLDLLENNLPWKESEEKYPAIICDLDGTLSIFEYIETFYNTKRRHKHLNNLTILEYQKSINNNLKNAA